MTDASNAARAPRSFREVWLCSAGHALEHWYLATFYILLPIIGKELGLSYTQIGLIMTVQHAAGAIANVPGGIVVDRVGRKGYLMAFSMFWVGIPYALMGLTQSYWMVLLCVSLVCMGNNLWHPAAISLLAHRYPERKGLVLSFHGMGGNAGEALAPLVIGMMLGWYSWRTVVTVNVVLGLIMSAMILALLGALTTSGSSNNSINAKSRRVHSLREYAQGVAGLLRNRGLMLMSIGGAFRTMTQAGLLTFLPVFLAYELHYSTLGVGVCMTVVQIAGFIGAPIGGHLSDKIGRKRVLMSAMLLCAVLIVGIALAGRTVFFVGFVTLIGFFLYATRSVLQAWAIESTPKHLAGAGVGVQFGITSLGASISPAVFGMIADAFDIYTAFYFLAGTIIVANLLVFAMPEEPHTEAPLVEPGRA
jgi:FSR family fosmidomycin resistance protein-like MFS transporter